VVDEVCPYFGLSELKIKVQGWIFQQFTKGQRLKLALLHWEEPDGNFNFKNVLNFDLNVSLTDMHAWLLHVYSCSITVLFRDFHGNTHTLPYIVLMNNFGGWGIKLYACSNYCFVSQSASQTLYKLLWHHLILRSSMRSPVSLVHVYLFWLYFFFQCIIMITQKL
jgi:hypothetical protein